MASNTPPPNADKFAAQLRQAHEKLAGSVGGEGASQQVMAGFADAYRAWLEAMSAKPETMLDLQGRYMQEQMRLWMNSMQPAHEAGAEEASDKRFAGHDWDQLPVFPSFPPPYLLPSKIMLHTVVDPDLPAPTNM